MIAVKTVKKCYGEKMALDNVRITIQDGNIFGLVGLNGGSSPR